MIVLKKHKLYKNIIPAFIFFFLLFIIIGLSNKNTDTTIQSGWSLQTDLNNNLRGRIVYGMTFIDAATGFAVTDALNQSDTCFIFKTTNGGDNWFVSYWSNEMFSNAFAKIEFITDSIGYACGGAGYALTCKTTNRGVTWVKTSFPPVLNFINMCIIDTNTVITINDETMTGGIFRTTNGGLNWVRICNDQRPFAIYMINAQTGFINSYSAKMHKSTNGGFNWFNVNDTMFICMKFIDTLYGYRSKVSYGEMQKTTNGGYSWYSQFLPSVPGVGTVRIIKNFTVNYKDTIYGVAGSVWYPNPGRDRGLIYKTTNGGVNWGYQLPDTHAIQIPNYDFIKNYGANNLWAYNKNGMGIHTTTGGDTTYYVGISNQTESVPKDFVLYQNYPNPFNPSTNIRYQISNNRFVTLKIYDMLGKEIAVLVNEKQNAGEYEVIFNATDLPSGVYYYVLYADGVRVEARKMILIK